MSKKVIPPEPISPAEAAQVDLVIANTCSRLGCTPAQAREHIARQAGKPISPPTKEANPPGSKSDEELL